MSTNPRIELISKASLAGFYLKQQYIYSNSEQKINTICYGLLQAIYSQDKKRFMNTILQCYMYTKKEIPAIIQSCLIDDQHLQIIGYAFISGFIYSKKKKEVSDSYGNKRSNNNNTISGR